MLSKDTERILIGTWLVGLHLEDMSMFDARMFPTYPLLFEEMKRNAGDYMALARNCKMDHKQLSQLMQESEVPLVYQSAMADVSSTLAREWIAANPEAKPDQIRDAMQRFSVHRSELPRRNKNAVHDLVDEIDRRGREKPVRSGLSGLDNMMCGIRPKELTAVGARPSVGKSAFLQQIATTVARQGKKVLFFPLEMSEMSVMQRMLLSLVQLPQHEVRNGFSRQTWEKSSKAFDIMHKFMNEGNFCIFERCNDIQIIRQLILEHKPYMVVIDQLEQLKDGNRRWDGKRERFSHMTHELQAISLDMDVAVWFACQINRSADNTPPTVANLKESGTIEEDSTNVILLHRTGDKTEYQNIQIELAKQKDGECGVFETTFHAPKFTFYMTERRL